jgi:uncharacterized protein YdaU (DUF1376 family)
MNRRWYKRCGADFIHGTMMLSLEEKGAYSLCLDLIYDRGGPIPDDARWLAGVCGVSLRKWGAIRARLVMLGKLIETDGGMLSNARAADELVSAELSSRERAESGAKGGRNRAEKDQEARKSAEAGQAQLKREEKRREEVGDADASPPPASPDGEATPGAGVDVAVIDPGSKRKQRARRPGSRLSADWQAPPVSSLALEVQAIVHQWPAGAYETVALGFRNHWLAEGRAVGAKRDWPRTWENWLMREAPTVMRAAKAGVTYAAAASASVSAEERIAQAENTADFFERIGRADDAREFRDTAARLRGQHDPPTGIQRAGGTG